MLTGAEVSLARIGEALRRVDLSDCDGHTPGPWMVCRGIIHAGGGPVAEFWTRPSGADRALIERAPDLLAAYRAALDLEQRHRRMVDDLSRLFRDPAAIARFVRTEGITP